MVGMGEHDEFENRYVAKFEALLTEMGVVLTYRRDRAGIDTGLHLFAQKAKSSPGGEERPYWQALGGRVWFQLKGLHASTLSSDAFQNTDSLTVQVGVEHLKSWFAAPEPVYLIIYVESVDTFLGVDVRELVERRWGESFYPAMRGRAGQVSVNVPTAAIMNRGRVESLLEHRSMRVDGPLFRGRSLGHRIDPLRAVLAPPKGDLWITLVTRILQAHDFRETSRARVGALTVLEGVIAQSLLWQSPAFAEYGYASGDALRDEPGLGQAFGKVRIILDSAHGRTALAHDEAETLPKLFAGAGDRHSLLLVVFCGRELSGHGGLWRAWTREVADSLENDAPQFIGLESLSYLILTTTLVYLDVAPELDWDHVQYLD